MSDAGTAGDNDRELWDESSLLLEEMLADMCTPGTEIEYEGLRLVRLNTHHNQWRVYRSNGEVHDSLNLSAFQSVRQFATWLNQIVEGEEVDDGER